MERQSGYLRQGTLDNSALPEVRHQRPVGEQSQVTLTEDTGLPQPLQVRCFGAFVTYKRGEQIEQWSNRKARQLLAFLATRARCTATHAELTEALWPEYDFVTGQRLLYSAAWALRKTLDDRLPNRRAVAVARTIRASRTRQDENGFRASVLVSDRGRYALDPTLCRVDLATLRRQFEQMPPEAKAADWFALAMQLERPVFVDETYPWLASVRHAMRDRALYSFSLAAQRALHERDELAALAALHARLKVDPTHEESAGLAMRVHIHRGELARAAACYRSLCIALRQSCDQSDGRLNAPSRELQRLFASLQSPESVPAQQDNIRAPPQCAPTDPSLQHFPSGGTP